MEELIALTAKPKIPDDELKIRADGSTDFPVLPYWYENGHISNTESTSVAIVGA